MKQNKIYWGVVESRDGDPKKLGRCKVRVVGVHIEDNVLLPTDDLPWAYPLMPTHSASMSGIGYSPTGIVEGTWVAVTFRDQHQQHPVIMGTVGGIPEDDNVLEPVTTVTYKVNVQGTLMDSRGNPVLDSSGVPVLAGPVTVETITEPQLPLTDIKKPSSLSVSAAGIQFIMSKEALSSLTKGKNNYTFKSVDPQTIIYSYQDSGGRWTIGYGSTILADGSAVTEDTTILAKDAPTLLNRHIAVNIEAQLKKQLVAPVTQQMYDAMVDLMYNGGGSFLKSDVFSSINTGKYRDAAALIPMWHNTVNGKPNEGVQNRRNAEQQFFLSGGIPNASFSDVIKDKPAPVPTLPVVSTTTTTTGGTTVETVNTTNDAVGFRDPNGVYPTKTLLNEPDTHRLARSENIYETIVFAKEAARARHIREAFWIKLKKEWDQPEIPFNAKYPFNQTRVTESGHVEEWDDTDGSERIHRYHKAGTYEEVDRNGTMVRRIVGDAFDIYERNGNVVIRGTCNVTIQGDSNIRCENDAKVEVLGKCETRVTGDYTLTSKGDMKFRSEGKIRIESLKNVEMHADTTMHFESVGNMDAIAARIDLNESDPPPPIANPEPWEFAQGVPDFGDLVVVTRTTEDGTNFESPVEGDSTAFRDNAVVRGDLNPDDAPTPSDQPSTELKPTAPPPLDVTKTPTVAVDPNTIGEITRGMQLSPNYKLGDLMGNGGGVPTDQLGVTALQAVTNLKWIANNILEPIRAKYPNMVVTSGWRSVGRNAGIVGASKTSDHLKGGAVDMAFTGFSQDQLLQTAADIQAMVPTYKQILVEYKGQSKWVHCGVYGPDAGVVNTRTIGTMDVDNNKFYGGVFRSR